MPNRAQFSVTESERDILKCLTKHKDEIVEGSGTLDIGEISVTTGIRDKDEVLRALYTLEGRSLVSPHPAGDFTSNQWTITDVGVKAHDYFG